MTSEGTGGEQPPQGEFDQMAQMGSDGGTSVDGDDVPGGASEGGVGLADCAPHEGGVTGDTVSEAAVTRGAMDESVMDQDGVGDGGTGRDRTGDGGPPSRGPVPVRVRKAPRYRAFVLTGVLAGLLAAAAVDVVDAATGRTSVGSGVVYLLLGFGLIGAVVGAGGAVMVERRQC